MTLQICSIGADIDFIFSNLQTIRGEKMRTAPPLSGPVKL
jgi:hypothetical protein